MEVSMIATSTRAITVAILSSQNRPMFAGSQTPHEGRKHDCSQESQRMTYLTHIVREVIDGPLLDGSSAPAMYRDSFDVRHSSEGESEFIRVKDGRGVMMDHRVRNSASKQWS